MAVNTQLYLHLLEFFTALFVLFMVLFFLNVWRKKVRLKSVQEHLEQKDLSRYLQAIAQYQRLSSKQKAKIQRSIISFIAQKTFMGVGIEVSDEMRVVIAFHACLLLLHHEEMGCYAPLERIIIYPNTVVAKQVQNSGGIYTKAEFLLEGQASGSTVVIAWHEAKRDAYHLYENSLLFHEFAHEVDFLDGVADGAPPLVADRYHEFAKAMHQRFQNLQQHALSNRQWGSYKLLGAYAATNEAEFFAVLSERYFEVPEKLKKHFPDLYQALNRFYQFY